MESEQIKAKILADYTTLLTLKFDSPQLIKDKFKLIGEHISQLNSLAPEDKSAYEKAAELIQSAMASEYLIFSQAVSDEDKQQALAQLSHKAAEACQLVGIHR